MRLGQVGASVAIASEDGWINVAAASAERYPTVDEVLRSWPDFLEWVVRLPAGTAGRPWKPGLLTALVRRPGQVIGVGLNYVDRVSVAGSQRADLPVFSPSSRPAWPDHTPTYRYPMPRSRVRSSS